MCTPVVKPLAVAAMNFGGGRRLPFRTDKGGLVSLSDSHISPQIAVSDLARAVQFYEGALGLKPTGEQHEGTRRYACGDGTTLQIYAAPSHAGKATATVAQWQVADLDAVIAELSEAGVRFERYGPPVLTDTTGVHDSGYGRVAWFKDPDGNTFALEGKAIGA
jgi:predicted enzyme related to lactoylglutathione lyase